MKQRMGMLWLLLGGCFLWNPIVGVRDFLPDAIGYLLICIGLERVSDLNDGLAEAKKAFRAMIWVGVGQLAAWLLISQFFQKTDAEMSRYEEPVWVLVFSFAALALEWYFMLPGWKKLFSGLAQLAERHGGSAILLEKRGITRWESLLSATRVFVICKTVLTVLPETAVLSSIEKEAREDQMIFDLFPYSSLFRLLAVLLGLVIGVIWLIGYVRLMRSAMKDKPMQDRLWERYSEEILPDTGLLLSRRIRASFGCLLVGAVLCINLTVLYRQMLPDWCAAVVILVGCAMLGHLFRGFSLCLAIAAVSIPVGVARAILTNRFLEDEFIPAAVLRSPVAYQRYLPIRLLGWGEALLCLALLLLVMRTMLSLVRSHTAMEYADDPALSQRATEKLHAEMRKKAALVWIFWILMAGCKILEIELQPKYGWIWMVQLAVSVTSAIFFYGFLNRLAELMEEKNPPRRRV